MSDKIIAQAMREYGSAIRVDWSELDGRAVRNQLDILADALAGNGNSKRTLSQWREFLGVCPDGGGHWSGSCQGYCETDDGCPSIREEALS